MKLFIAATQKSGNVWLENLLANVYSIPAIDMALRSQMPPPIGQEPFVTHQHYMPTSVLLEWAREHGVRFLTTIRHPADIFVSFYHYVNSFFPLWKESGWVGISPSYVMYGKAIDSPEVLEFLAGDFRSYLLRSVAWMRSGQSLLVRYEDLLADTPATLRAVTQSLSPVDDERIEDAVEACRIERMRETSDLMKLHCRRGGAGGWRDELSDAHVEIFELEYRRELDLLGYSMRREESGAEGRSRATADESVAGDAWSPEATRRRLAKLQAELDTKEEAAIAAQALLEAASKELGWARRTIELRDEELASVKHVLAARDEELDSIRPAFLSLRAEMEVLKATAPSNDPDSES